MSHPGITDLAAEPLDVALLEPFGIAGGAQHVAANVLVTLRLSDGTTGIGEAAPFPAVNGETQAGALSAITRARAAVIGAPALRWRHVAARLDEAIHDAPSARCAIESALYDALCRRAGIPLWSFFGGAVSSLESDITVPTGSLAHARDSAASAAARGFSTLKIKVGGATLDHDVARVRAIGEAAPRTQLVLDANASLDVGSAIALLDALGALRGRVALFEQPTPAGDHDALRAVRERGRVLVAADESARSAADVAALATSRAVDVVNVKIMKTGVAEALDMVAAARAHGLGLMIGGMVETSLAMGVSACLAAGTGGFAFVDLDTPLFMRDEPFAGGPRRDGPSIHVDGSDAGHGVRFHPSARS